MLKVSNFEIAEQGSTSGLLTNKNNIVEGGRGVCATIFVTDCLNAEKKFDRDLLSICLQKFQKTAIMK